MNLNHKKNKPCLVDYEQVFLIGRSGNTRLLNRKYPKRVAIATATDFSNSSRVAATVFGGSRWNWNIQARASSLVYCRTSRFALCFFLLLLRYAEYKRISSDSNEVTYVQESNESTIVRVKQEQLQQCRARSRRVTSMTNDSI